MSTDVTSEKSTFTVFGRWVLGNFLMFIGFLLAVPIPFLVIYPLFFDHFFRNWYGLASMGLGALLLSIGWLLKSGTTIKDPVIVEARSAIWFALTRPMMVVGILLVVAAVNLAVAGLVGWTAAAFHPFVPAVWLLMIGLMFMRASR